VRKTPYELWIGNKPDVSHTRVFGSTCWVVLHMSHIDGTFGDKAAKGVFLGYLEGSRTYNVILDDGKVYKARSVVFAETKVSEVAKVAEKFVGDEVFEGETGLRSASDGEAVDADDDDRDDKKDDGSDMVGGRQSRLWRLSRHAASERQSAATTCRVLAPGEPGCSRGAHDVRASNSRARIRSVADCDGRGDGGHPQEIDLALDGSPCQSTRAQGKVG